MDSQNASSRYSLGLIFYSGTRMEALGSQSCFNCNVLLLGKASRYRIKDIAGDMTMWEKLKLNLGVNEYSCLCQECFEEYQSTTAAIQEPVVEITEDLDPLMGSAGGHVEDATALFEEPRRNQHYDYRIKFATPEVSTKLESSYKTTHNDEEMSSDDDDDNIIEPVEQELSSDDENVDISKAPPILDSSKLECGTKCDVFSTGLQKEYRNLPDKPKKNYIETKTFAREPATKRFASPDQACFPKRLCSHKGKQNEKYVDHSEDEDHEDYEDAEDYWMATDATPTGLRSMTRKMREFEIYQLEGEQESAANVLEQANELLQEERLASSSRQSLSLLTVELSDTSRIGLPLGSASPLSSQPAADSETFNWSADFSTFQGQAEQYLRSPGPHTNAQIPLGVFMEVWDLRIMNLIAAETNRYAWQTITSMTERGEDVAHNLGKWKETNAEEIYRFFAVLNYMSICYRSSLDEYWNTGILEMSEFRKIMSRERFIMILRFLHFVNNDVITPIGRSEHEYRRAKIAPVVDHCNYKFAELYTPSRELSLEESLLLWKGRLSWVQCISKAARFGIKSYELCEAESGYLLRMLLCAGKHSSTFEGSMHGCDNATVNTIVELMDGYLNVGHLLVIDNWYNQLELTRFLKSHRTDVIGTMCRQRKNVPDRIKSAVDRDLAHGDQIAFHCGDISMITWKDVKLVTFISTYHKADVDTHRDDDDQERTKPQVVMTYKKSMGGVDLKDQRLSQYFFESKHGRKWYIKVFRRLLNISILNTFTVAGKIAGFNNNEKFTMQQYRYKLSEDILRTFPRVRETRSPIVTPRPGGKFSVRLEDTSAHFPMNTAKVKGKLARRRCVCCSARRKQTRVTTMCKRCNVALCLGECWIDYHTLPNLEPKKTKPMK
ncbi:hypothetical protein O0L34_g3642 [Tuta absoluta]|nr:hypothetical protein O0L34_g3642 [Tuta absoluta]